MKRWFTPLIVWFCLILSTGLSSAQVSKIAPDLLSLLSGPLAPVDVVIQFNKTPGLLDLTKLLSLGGVITQQLPLINGVAVRLPKAVVSLLALDSAIGYITPDRLVTGTVDLSVAAVNAQSAYQVGLNGAGVGVAILDSGIYNHPDLAGRISYRQSFVPKTADDDYGHGTHVAGIVAGSGASSSGPQFTRSFRGVAPGTHLIDLRVLDRNGMSSDSIVIAALERAISLKSKYQIRVINMSIGRPIKESSSLDPLCKAVAAAWKSGIVVVVSAGNLGRNGYSTITSPGNSPYVITVGAMKTKESAGRADDQIASYSSKGPTWIDLSAKPDLVAPGNLVDSLLAPGSTLVQGAPGNVVPASSYVKPGYNAGAAYFQLSGTSMAAPVVSAAAALLLQREPNLSPDTIKARLMKTASKNFPLTSIAVDANTNAVYPSTYDMFTVGAGYLDLAAALNNYDSTNGAALSPSFLGLPILKGLLLKPAGSTWDNYTWSLSKVWGSQMIQPLIGGASAAWGEALAWGSSAAWGEAIAWGSSAAWGESFKWGTSAAWGESWGSSAAWGESILGEK